MNRRSILGASVALLGLPTMAMATPKPQLPQTTAEVFLRIFELLQPGEGFECIYTTNQHSDGTKYSCGRLYLTSLEAEHAMHQRLLQAGAMRHPDPRYWRSFTFGPMDLAVVHPDWRANDDLAGIDADELNRLRRWYRIIVLEERLGISWDTSLRRLSKELK
jgi:hypothetical protein